jgi:hypothetical protein
LPHIVPFSGARPFWAAANDGILAAKFRDGLISQKAVRSNRADAGKHCAGREESSG